MADRWRRVGAYVRQERSRRRLTQVEFAAAVGLSTRTVTAIETGTRSRYDANTIAALEDALCWQPGSVTRVLEGREPRTTDPHLAAIQAAWPRLSTDARAMLARLAVETADD